MGFSVSGFLKGAQDRLAKESSKFNNKTVAEALTAACAYVATADGEVEAEEKTKVGKLFASHPIFAPFDKPALVASFNQYVDHGLEDILRPSVLDVVRKANSKPDHAAFVAQAGMAVAGADGEVEDSEVKALREICGVLNLSPSTIGL